MWWKSRALRDFFFFLILGCLTVYAVFGPPFLQIKNIEIINPEGIPQEKIKEIVLQELNRRFLLFFQQNTFFALNTQKIRQEILKKFPEVKEVKINKQLQGELFLELNPRNPVALWCNTTDSQCFLIGEDRVLFRKDSQKNLGAGLALIFSEKHYQIGQEVLDESQMNNILVLYRELQENQKIIVASSTLTADNSLLVKTGEGWEIRLDLADDIKIALLKLKALLEKDISPEQRKELQYIDLRFSKVYYK